MKKSETARSKFPGFNCSQSVFVAYAIDFNLDEATSLRIASGFGGGMACAGVCGAVTGSYMAIGMKHGHVKNDPDAKAFTKSQIKKFNELFIAKNGSIVCKELLGTDISTPEGAQYATENNLFEKVCPCLIGSACDILDESFM